MNLIHLPVDIFVPLELISEPAPAYDSLFVCIRFLQ